MNFQLGRFHSVKFDFVQCFYNYKYFQFILVTQLFGDWTSFIVPGGLNLNIKQVQSCFVFSSSFWEEKEDS